MDDHEPPGELLEHDVDAIVGPARSFGWMDGGPDLKLLERYGTPLQQQVHTSLRRDRDGELPVGMATSVPLPQPGPATLVIAPTMRVPMRRPADTGNLDAAPAPDVDATDQPDHTDDQTGPDAGAPPTPLDGPHRLHLDDQLIEVLLADGRGLLPDARRVELDRRLTTTPSARPARSTRPRSTCPSSVRTTTASDGSDVPPTTPASSRSACTRAVSRPASRSTAGPTPATTFSGPLRYEQRWSGGPGAWTATSDGPVTRAAREAVAHSGLHWAEGDTLLCTQPPGPRGTIVSCHELASDGPGQVGLLIVDDDLGYRIEVARTQLLTGEDIAHHLGDQTRCADIHDLAETGSLPPVMPFAAVSSWFHQGQPARMDASGQGRPCATVSPGSVELLHGGTDGRIVETYRSLIT